MLPPEEHLSPKLELPSDKAQAWPNLGQGADRAPLDFDGVESAAHLLLTAVGPDRLGIVHAIASSVFKRGGTIAASRMAKLDDNFAVVMKLLVPDAAADAVEADLCKALRGIQVSVKRLIGEAETRSLRHAEVECVCPQDTPGLLMRFTAALLEADLDHRWNRNPRPNPRNLVDWCF